MRVHLRPAKSWSIGSTIASSIMKVSDASSLLDAVAASYGIRWMWLRVSPPRKVAFVSQQDYIGSAAGLRHALSEVLPAELWGSVIGDPGGRNGMIEAQLKRMPVGQMATLERLTAKGAVPSARFPWKLPARC